MGDAHQENSATSGVQAPQAYEQRVEVSACGVLLQKEKMPFVEPKLVIVDNLLLDEVAPAAQRSTELFKQLVGQLRNVLFVDVKLFEPFLKFC